MKEEEFPKSAKELYDNLVNLNKFNAIKINKKFVKKYYDFISNIKDVYPPRGESPTEIFKSQDLKNEVITYLIRSIKEANNKKTKDKCDSWEVPDYQGNCPNCKNKLISTRGFSRIAHPAHLLMRGAFCLNCGKSFLRYSPSIIKEYDEPQFIKSAIK